MAARWTGRGAAAAADDARPAVAGEAGVDRHLLGRAVILDLVVDEVRHAAIALGDDDVVGAEHAGHARERRHEFGRADAAIGAVGERARLQLLAAEDGDLGRCHAHHGAAVGIEGEGADDGQAGPAGALDGGRELVLRRHGLDPDDVGAALGEGVGLLGERGGALGDGERAERLEQLAGRADVAGDHDLAAAAGALVVGDAAGDAGGQLVQLGDAVLGLVQLQAIARAAEAIGEDDVGAGRDHGAVQRLDAVDVIDVPQLGRVAGEQAHVEQVGAGGAIGQQEGPLREQAGEAV